MTQTLNGQNLSEINAPSWTYLQKGEKLAMLSYGPSLDRLLKVSECENLGASIVNARFIKPIDESFLIEVLKTHEHIFIYEEIANQGGLYPRILDVANRIGFSGKIIQMSITDQIIHHGNYKEILSNIKMDQKDIMDALKGFNQ